MGRVGEVITRTWQTARQDARAARAPRRARRGDERQPAHPALRRQVHDQPGHRARHGARDRLGRGRQAGRPGALAAGVLRRQAGAGDQGRLHRLGADGRRQRVDPHAAAACACARCSAPSAAPTGATSIAFVSQRGARGGPSAALGLGKQLVGGARLPRPRQARHVLNDALPRITVDPETYEVRADGELLRCEPADAPARSRSATRLF